MIFFSVIRHSRGVWIFALRGSFGSLLGSANYPIRTSGLMGKSPNWLIPSPDSSRFRDRFPALCIALFVARGETMAFLPPDIFWFAPARFESGFVADSRR